MKKCRPILAALAVSLLMSTATIAGELQTPGAAGSPPTAGSAPGDLGMPGLYRPSGEVSPSMKFIYDLLAMIF